MNSAPMNPEDVAANDSVTATIEILAPPERVFAALTDQPQLFTWWGREPSVELTAFEMDARLGGHWSFRCKPVTSHGAVGEQLKQNDTQEFEAHGEVLVFEPPYRLAWSWSANWHRDPQAVTTVHWELIPTATGTFVRVTHSGLASDVVAYKDYTSGWVGVLRLLNGFF